MQKRNKEKAWQNQQKEFADIPGAVLFTTNCLMPPKPSYKDRVFTTEVVSFPDVIHVGEDKDFSPVIKKALELGGYDSDRKMTGINGGNTVMTGFAHKSVLDNAGAIVDAVKAGDIKHFFLVGGCDGARPGRNYFTEFVKQTPSDSIILTLACGKYRFNDLDLGKIGDFPRIMDMGQCNDAYSAIKVAVALSEAFGCSVNELPLSMVLSWYEQKAVCILLTLLYLGIKNIKLGPTLPAFISKNVLAKTGLTIGDFDLIEANEAFAAQSIAVARDLGFDMSKVNVNGGAIALGHPVGASGCRILVTLLHEMKKRGANRGLATLCIGGGMGCSTIVEKY